MKMKIKVTYIILITLLCGCGSDEGVDYFSNGNIKSKSVVKGDTLFKINYFAQGGISEKICRVNGELDGAYLSFYKNGNLEKEISYKNGVRHGDAHYFTAANKKRSYLKYYDNEVYYKNIIRYDSLEEQINNEYIGLYPILRAYNDSLVSENLVIKYILPDLPSPFRRSKIKLNSVIKSFAGDSLISEKNIHISEFTDFQRDYSLKIKNVDSVNVHGRIKYVGGDTILFDEFRRGIIVN